MKLGSLFSGGGLGDFGFLAAGMDITWQCEIDEYCQKILALRYPESKKYRDIKTLKGAELEKVDIITGGFPCQPFSVAGEQMGKSDDRYLWPDMFQIIEDVHPRWVVVENVSGFVHMALDDVWTDLESAGYEVGAVLFPAHALGAWHVRDRIWIIAYSIDSINSGRPRKNTKENGVSEQVRPSIHARMPNGTINGETSSYDWGERIQRKWEESLPWLKGFQGGEDVGRLEEIRRRFNIPEPLIRRMDNGTTRGMDRLKMLGNGQVPACTYVIGKMIMEIEQCNSAPTKST